MLVKLAAAPFFWLFAWYVGIHAWCTTSHGAMATREALTRDMGSCSATVPQSRDRWSLWLYVTAISRLLLTPDHPPGHFTEFEQVQLPSSNFIFPSFSFTAATSCFCSKLSKVSFASRSSKDNLRSSIVFLSLVWDWKLKISNHWIAELSHAISLDGVIWRQLDWESSSSSIIHVSRAFFTLINTLRE